MTADVKVIDRQLRRAWRLFHPPQSWSHDPASLAASGTRSDAAPAFVQLGVVGADVIPDVPQPEERLAAELRRYKHEAKF